MSTIKKIIENFSKLHPDTYFVIPFPVKHFKYYEDGFFQNPNVIREPYVIPLAKKINNITFDGAFLQQTYRKILYKHNIQPNTRGDWSVKIYRQSFLFYGKCC